MEDLTNISTLRQRRFEQKDVAGPPNGNELNILNITSGAGLVNYLWLAMRPGSGGGFPQFDFSVRVYTDGSSTPDIDTDIGLFLGYAFGQIYSQENIACTHWHAKSGSAAHLSMYGGGCRLAIPFSNGIRIAVANTNSTPTAAVFSQANYVLAADNSGMTVPPYRLHVTGNKWIGGQITLPSSNVATLATISAGSPGVIVGHSMAGSATSGSYNYLERYIGLFIDGESTPSIESSGTEDWFTASDYWFYGQTPMSSPGAMALGAGPYDQNGVVANGFSALVDILALTGGYPFTGSGDTTLQWLTHSAATSNCNYGSCLFYYRHT